MLSVARRRTIQALRWISLPLAALCVGGPVDSLVWVYRHYAGKTLTEAKVLSATLKSSGTKGMGAWYDVYASYPVGFHNENGNVSVSVSFRTLAAGDTLWLFVDPKTGEAEDDIRADSWVMLGIGILAATFFVLVNFRYGGKVLRRDAL